MASRSLILPLPGGWNLGIDLKTKRSETLLRSNNSIYSDPYLLGNRKIILTREIQEDGESSPAHPQIVAIDTITKEVEIVLDGAFLMSVSEDRGKILVWKRLGKEPTVQKYVYWLDLGVREPHEISNDGNNFDFVGWFSR